LNEIQQKKHQVLPVQYTHLLKTKNSKEFLMAVSIDDLTFTGSGKNKNTAKQNAAEGLLKKMGYSALSSRNELPLGRESEFNTGSVTKDKPVIHELNLKSPADIGMDKDNAEAKDTKYVSVCI